MIITDPGELSRVTRFCILNVWRPVHGTVLDTPLALCDARTVSTDDLVPCDVKYRQRVGEIYLANYSTRHRWFYFSRMEKQEALIFKQYDSEIGGPSRFTLHAAFDHPQAPTDAPPRESIELRCLLTY